MNPNIDILAALDDIDALAAKATEGPWSHGPFDRNCNAWITNKDSAIGRITFAVDPEAVGTLDLICASRDGWPATVAALRVAVRGLQYVSRGVEDMKPTIEAQEAGDVLSAVRSLLKGEKP